MDAFLPRILASRRAAVEAAKARHTVGELERQAADLPPPRDFHAALAAPGMSLIAEIKRASPSRGVLNASLDPAGIARGYERGGARAVSVLTEPEFFKGSAADLIAARGATAVPVLWKDFVVDPYQVVGARAAGADAVLVIVRVLGDAALREVLDETARWGMSALVEVFDEGDLDRALGAEARIVGVNHRDLETFAEDPEATARLRPRIPEGVVVVGESAITERADVAILEEIGVHAVLVGEAIVRAADPEAKIGELLGRGGPQDRRAG